MRTITVTVVLVLMFATGVYAFGDKFGFEAFGAKKFGASKWGSGGEAIATYWNTSYADTGDWNTAYGADWGLPYNTEIP